ncbi:protein phosphatase CheZ, partial [Undibacterium sp.]|uniref:protein phosphatase CheZ n=1 Tax=Undibacterium sp. TaxID=1914977 RepID=UPI00375279D2
MSQTPPAVSGTSEDNPELMYKGLGHVVRALHDALTWVGADDILAEASNEFPSARERLNHVAVLTEKAANTVLSNVETTLPLQQATTKEANALLAQWDQAPIESLSKEELLALALSTRKFINQTQSNTLQTEQALSDIMMAQDFQDLTGQLIKKVVTLLERTETDLLGLLISGAPDGAISAKKKDDLLAGPGSV